MAPWRFRYASLAAAVARARPAAHLRRHRAHFRPLAGLAGDSGSGWPPQSYNDQRWTRTTTALQTYRELHGDLRVPIPFVVPAKAPWPEVCREMTLGETVSSIRSKQRFVKGRPERRAWLDSVGFVWDEREQRGIEEH